MLKPLTQRSVAVVRRTWSRLGTTTGERLARALTLVCVALGLWLRARGFLYDRPSFWLDESAWAIYLIEEPLRELIIRPIGFMALSKLVVAVFGPTETALRALPWLAAMAGTLFSPWLARLLFRSPAARLLFVAVIALHPSAYSFAKEFKPYSVSLTLHLMLATFALSYAENRRKTILWWLLGTAVVGTLFAQDLVFAYPSVFLIAGFTAWRKNREQLVAVAIGCAIVMTALLTQYFLIWSRIPTSDNQIWGDKYGTFFVDQPGTYFGWVAERYQGLAAFPGFQSRFWNAPWLSKEQWVPYRDVANAVWVVVHSVGVVSLVVWRRAREALLLLLPLFLCWLFNLLGFWPFGVFRANLFVLVYVAGIAAMAFDRPLPPKYGLLQVLPASVLVLIPLLVFEQGWGPSKHGLTYVSKFADVVRWLADRTPRRGQPKQIIILARGYCYPWRYYLEYHPQVSRLKKKIERGFDARCIQDRAALGDSLIKATTSTTIPTWLIRAEGTVTGDLKSLAVVEKRDFGRDVVTSFTRQAGP